MDNIKLKWHNSYQNTHKTMINKSTPPDTTKSNVRCKIVGDKVAEVLNVVVRIVILLLDLTEQWKVA